MTRMGMWWMAHQDSQALAWWLQSLPSWTGWKKNGDHPENCFAVRTFSRLICWKFSNAGVDLVPALQEYSFRVSVDSSCRPSNHQAGTLVDSTGVLSQWWSSNTPPLVCFSSITTTKRTMFLLPVCSGTLCPEVITYSNFLESQKNKK